MSNQEEQKIDANVVIQKLTQSIANKEYENVLMSVQNDELQNVVDKQQALIDEYEKQDKK